MRVLSFLLILTFISGCSFLRSELDRVPLTLTPEEMAEDAAFYDPKPPKVKPVLALHWSCCADNCKGKRRIHSVTTELETPYILCQCKNGKIFRITRIRGVTLK